MDSSGAHKKDDSISCYKIFDLYSSDKKLVRWGYGEWVEEADVVEFNYRSVNCRVVRGSYGSLLGYVEVPEVHEWNGKHYRDIPADVHGGLTFGECVDNEKRLYWIGFDCAHSGDICPQAEALRQEHEKMLYNFFKELNRHRVPCAYKRSYKNVSFVIEECKKLVDQMLEVKNAQK